MRHSHGVTEAWPSPAFFLNGSFKEGILIELVGLELRGLFFSVIGAVEARQGKQLLGKIPQLFSIPPSPPLLVSSTERLEISSWPPKGFTPCSKLPFDCSPDFWLLWFWSVERLKGVLLLPPPLCISLDNEVLDAASLSKPFNENTSAKFPPHLFEIEVAILNFQRQGTKSKSHHIPSCTLWKSSSPSDSVSASESNHASSMLPGKAVKVSKFRSCKV